MEIVLNCVEQLEARRLRTAICPVRITKIRNLRDLRNLRSPTCPVWIRRIRRIRRVTNLINQTTRATKRSNPCKSHKMEGHLASHGPQETLETQASGKPSLQEVHARLRAR